MMCSIDPDTAKDATITFAKYLRGNMDSLKQTAPVPFEQELEHLKKIGAADAIRKSYNALSVNVDVLDCDYYRFAELLPGGCLNSVRLSSGGAQATFRIDSVESGTMAKGICFSRQMC